MNYSNQYHNTVSTVQLSPFGEDQWNRIITYSPFYVHWTDIVMMAPKRRQKSASGKRNVLNLIDVDSIKLNDDELLNEINDIRKTTAMSTLSKKNSFNEATFLDEEYDRRPSSPTDEYQRSSDFFNQTREASKPHPSFADSSFSYQQSNTKRSPLQPQTSNNRPLKALSNINFGPKPQASLSVQLRQSAITREHALSTSNDHRITSPLTMSSSRRALGSAHSGRRTNQQQRTAYSQTPQTVEINTIGGLCEQLRTDLSSSVKKSYPRSTNSSRSTIHRLKTKNERAREKQHVELKTILVKPCRQPISSDSDLEESIPNSLDMMRKLGGSITAFEKNLRYNYNRQLNQFRIISTK